MECDIEKSSAFLTSFESACEDDRFMTISATMTTIPGDTDDPLLAPSKDGNNYVIYYLEEANYPFCFPRSCSYNEARTILDIVANEVEIEFGYDSFKIQVEWFSSTSTNSSSGATAIRLVVHFTAIASALLLTLS